MRTCNLTQHQLRSHYITSPAQPVAISRYSSIDLPKQSLLVSFTDSSVRRSNAVEWNNTDSTLDSLRGQEKLNCYNLDCINLFLNGSNLGLYQFTSEFVSLKHFKVVV